MKLVWLYFELQECKMEQKADFQGSVSCAAVWLHVAVVGEKGGKRFSLTFWHLMLYYLLCLGVL